MTTKPGRLYRWLKDCPKPIFEVESDFGIKNDDWITSLKMHHGQDGPEAGLSPSTLEAGLWGPLWPRSGEQMKVRLTAAAASYLASRTGISANNFVNRFAGRVGSQTNTQTAKTVTTTMNAASWTAQLSSLKHTVWLGSGYTIADAIRYLVKVPPIEANYTSYSDFGTFDQLADDIADATLGTLGTIATDTGIQIRDTRAGGVEVWALPYRKSWAEGRISGVIPLTTSQAISPVTWVQPNEDMPKKVRADWVNANGTPNSRSAGGTEASAVERHDWKHTRDLTGSLDIQFEALLARNWNRTFEVPSITVDMLYLLRSPIAYHRQQAGHLLSLNAGDTVNLSGDWHPYIRGVHVATAFEETITKDEWTITLSLCPWRLIFGGESPNVPARIWDSATYPWNDETRKWNEA